MIGGKGDPNRADAVIETTRFTAHQLWTLVDQKKFNKEAVEAIIESGRNAESSEPTSNVKDD